MSEAADIELDEKKQHIPIKTIKHLYQRAGIEVIQAGRARESKFVTVNGENRRSEKSHPDMATDPENFNYMAEQLIHRWLKSILRTMIMYASSNPKRKRLSGKDAAWALAEHGYLRWVVAAAAVKESNRKVSVKLSDGRVIKKDAAHKTIEAIRRKNARV